MQSGTGRVYETPQGALPARALHPDPDFAALQQLATKSRYPRNQTIFSDGDIASYAYKVVSGTVRQCKHTADGRRQIAGFRLPGEFFGFMEPEQYSFTAEAVTDVVLAAYPRRLLDLLSDSRPAIRKHFTTLMSRRLVEMQDQAVLLGQRTAMERIASFLLALSERTGSEDDDVIDLPMSRQDMADFLGLTIETVCRALSDLKRAGSIRANTAHQFELVRRQDLLQVALGSGTE